ncbi:MAG: cofactor-independent phosphoglycerate mutase [Candidatus Margulisbacteria bacterium]|jgi:2,3-bisphosphoglycerate-independent phosphoglycerate mutase|nr:cofactor-independent phosphoglycerate mutase [Candidatus Margulisiibacteriota bacterium]
MTKYLILIGDGMADLPLRQLGGKTPLEFARTPNLDYLAQNGLCGWTNNTPAGLEPGSDVAAMSIFGYDPRRYYSGRGPLEAASLGVKLGPGEVAFRCNLVTIEDGKMKDFTAHHIATEQARRIFRRLNKELGSKEIKFYPGLSYRNLLVMKDDRAGTLAALKTTAPHDITGRPISSHLPKGKGADRIIALMNEAEVVLHGRKSPATLIWPWGQGAAPRLPLFKRRFRRQAAIITAVHLLKGLGKILGMKVINVPGATGYLDTNYRGKAEYALNALRHNDVVFVHVEAPDEAGHEGNIKHKLKAIEDFDRLVVGTILEKVKSLKSKVKILVLPDHPTPIRYKTHTSADVPFVIWPQTPAGRVTAYNEKAIGRSPIRIADGSRLLERFIERTEF